MSNIKKILLITLALLSFSMPKVMAFDLFPTCGGSKANSPTCQQASKQDKKNPAIDIINSAANIIAIVTGIIGVIMIILGGFTYVTSGGNSESVTNARRQITFALVGMVVVALAWTITRFITDKLVQ